RKNRTDSAQFPATISRSCSQAARHHSILQLVKIASEQCEMAIADELLVLRKTIANLDVVNAFDIEDAGDAFDACENLLELLAIANVEGYFDAGASVVFAAALEGTNVRTRFADHGGDS